MSVIWREAWLEKCSQSIKSGKGEKSRTIIHTHIDSEEVPTLNSLPTDSPVVHFLFRNETYHPSVVSGGWVPPQLLVENQINQIWANNCQVANPEHVPQAFHSCSFSGNHSSKYHKPEATGALMYSIRERALEFIYANCIWFGDDSSIFPLKCNSNVEQLPTFV